jgi:hypothetical protein
MIKNRYLISFLLSSALILLLTPQVMEAQDQAERGLSFQTSHFPDFRVDDSQFSPGSAYSLKFSYHDVDYSRMEYRFHYTRGYDSSVSYSYGVSAAAVFPLSDHLFLKPGVGADRYLMADRVCKSFVRAVLHSVFDTSDNCNDDLHSSINPFIALEIKFSSSISVVLQSSYRMMLSNTMHKIETETAPDGNEYKYDRFKSKNSFYSAGFGIGVGLKINY